jgi:DNA-binding IclR family transcriptional regulator
MTMSSLERMLGVLDLFSLDRPVWTADALAAALGYTRSTAYRYVKELVDAGLLARAGGGSYMLGPRIIELDRQIRLCDPLLAAAAPVMRGMLANHGAEVILLCSLYRDKVLCVHQERRDFPRDISYSRGRPMPLFRGATSRVMLAYLPDRQLARLFDRNRDEIAAAGLGASWEEFTAGLRALRRAGYCVSRGEVNEGVVGVAAPIFDGERRMIGSLSRVLTQDDFDMAGEDAIARSVMDAAQEIDAQLGALTADDDGTPARVVPQRALGRGRRDSSEAA